MLLSLSSCTILAWYSTPCIPYKLVVRSKDMISFKLNILARIPPGGALYLTEHPIRRLPTSVCPSAVLRFSVGKVVTARSLWWTDSLFIVRNLNSTISGFLWKSNDIVNAINTIHKYSRDSIKKDSTFEVQMEERRNCSACTLESFRRTEF